MSAHGFRALMGSSTISVDWALQQGYLMIRASICERSMNKRKDMEQLLQNSISKQTMYIKNLGNKKNNWDSEIRELKMDDGKA